MSLIILGVFLTVEPVSDTYWSSKAVIYAMASSGHLFSIRKRAEKRVSIEQYAQNIQSF